MSDGDGAGVMSEGIVCRLGCTPHTAALLGGGDTGAAGTVPTNRGVESHLVYCFVTAKFFQRETDSETESDFQFKLN